VTAKLARALVVALVVGLIPVTNGMVSASASVTAGSAFSGREVFKIVTVRSGERHAHVTASGAFDARGYFVRRTGTAVFGGSKIQIRRHVLRKGRSGPSLRTCRLRIWLSGTFRVTRATGRFRGLREDGRFSTTISITLAKTGANSCSATVFVAYRAVTYAIGRAR